MDRRTEQKKTLRYRFGPDRKLRKKADFDRVFSHRLSAADQHLILYGRANRAARSRMGISVGKKLGPAVRRNRYKRTLREAFRLCQHDLPAGFDYVLIPRPGRGCSAKIYRQSLISLAQKIAPRPWINGKKTENLP